MTSNNKAISNFIEKYFLHFNAAALVDAAKGYQAQLDENSKKIKFSHNPFSMPQGNIKDLNFEKPKLLPKSIKF